MFFFKQKTAYEMRISDWSSDVCSSDLDTHCAGGDQILRLLRVRRKVEIGEQNLAFAQQGPLFCLRLLDLDDHFRLLKNDRCRGHDFRACAAIIFIAGADAVPRPNYDKSMKAMRSRPKERRRGKEWVRAGK